MAALALLGLLMASSGAWAQSAVNRLPGVIDRPTPEVNLPPLPRPLPPLVGAPTPQTVPDANAPIPTITQVDLQRQYGGIDGRGCRRWSPPISTAS